MKSELQLVQKHSNIGDTMEYMSHLLAAKQSLAEMKKLETGLIDLKIQQ